MKSWLTISVLALAACAGTIDDPTRFNLQANADEGDVDPTTDDSDSDAGTPTGSRDAALDARSTDATTAITEDASTRDASSDARTPVSDAATGTSDAATCNFAQLMMNKCGSASCHGSGGAAAGLDLVSANLATRVADRQAGGSCGDFPLIDLEQPDNSALYRKVTDSACGARMPLGGVLSAAEQQCVLSWIEGL